MSYEGWIRDVYGEDPEKYMPDDPVKLSERQIDLIMMKVTYKHFANIEGFYIADEDLEKVLRELQF